MSYQSLLFISLMFCCMVQLCEPYKLLVVFPIPGKSHSILGNAFVKHLLDAGHQVTYITPIPMTASPRLRQINIDSNFEYLVSDDILDIQKLMTKEVDMKDFPTVFTLMYNIANATIHNLNVQKLLNDNTEQFDAVIVEWMYSELYSGFSAVFHCPFIWFLSVSPHSMALSLIDSNLNPAFTTDHIKSNSIPPLTLLERISELGTLMHWQLYRWWVKDRDNKSYNDAFKSAVSSRNLALPPLDEVKYNASLMFVNSHISTSDAVPVPRNLIEIGGYHINNTMQSLPEDLKVLMDRAKDGVILFSMGSMLKSTKFPEKIKHDIIRLFGQLKQTVIWKFEDIIEDKPTNLHIVNWAPQQSILAHSNCILFITHGGLLSTTEATYFGVPLIGIPMFADQFLNINRAVAKGFAKKVELDDDTPYNLKLAINEIITNNTYRERARELSFIYHDRIMSPGAEIARWIHHVITTGGAPHLRSPALNLSWYQKLYMDLFALIMIVMTSLFIAFKKMKNKKTYIVASSKKCR